MTAAKGRPGPVQGREGRASSTTAFGKIQLPMRPSWSGTIRAFVAAVSRAKGRAGSKGTYLQRAFSLSSTMGQGVSGQPLESAPRTS